MIARNGFWNSKMNADGTADRMYNADDFSFFYKSFFKSGILPDKSSSIGTQFKVTLTAGTYDVKINNGNCIVGGKWYQGYGQEATTIQMDISNTVPSGQKRWDAVCLRLDEENRTFEFYIKTGTPAASPSVPSINTDTELCFAYFRVDEGYAVQYGTLKDVRNNNSYSGLAATRLSDPITVVNFDDYVERYFYFCNGTDDNIQLSQIVQNYYASEKDRNLEIKVIGNIGISGWAAGTGTSSDPLQVFCIGKYKNTETNQDSTSNTNRVTVDFTDCNRFNISTAATGYATVVFGGNDNKIIGVRFYYQAAGTASTKRAFSGDNNIAIECDMRFWAEISGFETVTIFEGSGHLDKCFLYCYGGYGKIIGAVPKNDSKLLKITDCSFNIFNRASTSAGESAAIYINANNTAAVLIAERNKIGSSGHTSSYELDNTIKLNSGNYCVTNNILMKAGAYYTEIGVSNNITYASIVL